MLKFIRGIKVSFWRDWSRTLAYVLEIEYGDADIQILLDLAYPRVQTFRSKADKSSGGNEYDTKPLAPLGKDEIPF
jgi:hypothetical protein